VNTTPVDGLRSREMIDGKVESRSVKPTLLDGCRGAFSTIVRFVGRQRTRVIHVVLKIAERPGS